MKDGEERPFWEMGRVDGVRRDDVLRAANAFESARGSFQATWASKESGHPRSILVIRQKEVDDLAVFVLVLDYARVQAADDVGMSEAFIRYRPA